MGPQHPSTHGVLRVILKLDGEKVMGTSGLGYLHRGVEKIGENRRISSSPLRRPMIIGRGFERPGLLPGDRKTG